MKATIVKDFKMAWINYTASLKGVSALNIEEKYNSKYELDKIHRAIAGREVELIVSSKDGYSYMVECVGFDIHRSQAISKGER